ncbi:UDP-3-O-acyl-N-acetylglucosamine deacetylase [Prochlorococcus sp. MIT 1307]|uniref:UDP-3-O-acyl-N-acetylglucosamine deacetylase n=1 Tax=Prochlorococcus sp. MIT 1307 TaxID=3096219 RepID=UPI002A76046D|nr:UDP-3-O-acyl-N-acetylglucosamine deacetylase [Prochlorococcus sp. MIT 1307]
MTCLPNNYEGAWTLAKTVLRRGIGLHTGEEAEVRLSPYEKAGFHVSWIDSGEAPITLSADQAFDTQLCTTLQLGNHRLSTVEHLLAALGGCGISHVLIEVSGQEIPLLDGSALCWVEAILEAGLAPACTPRLAAPLVNKPLAFHRGHSVITATPAEKFTLVGIIDFPYPAIGQQMLTIQLTPNVFVKEIAPARTFGFKDQLEKLQKSGLIKGGTLDNALVCDCDDWINPPLRFKDEPVRHKLLDLIGDLALVGFPNAQVLVYRGSHCLHNDLAASLLQ